MVKLDFTVSMLKSVLHHAEHRSRQDSEFCPSGHYFKQNPGRTARLSDKPVK